MKPAPGLDCTCQGLIYNPYAQAYNFVSRIVIQIYKTPSPNKYCIKAQLSEKPEWPIQTSQLLPCLWSRDGVQQLNIVNIKNFF